MYKIDDEFRPRGRVFMKAQREHEQSYPPSSALVSRSSSRSSTANRKGPAITTNLDDSNLRFRHEIMNEKVIEATVTELPGVFETMNRDHWRALPSSMGYGNELVVAHPGGRQVVSEVTRNKRLTTEVLGNTMETTSTSQRASDGHRRMTTHIVRKITTLTRAEEQAQADNRIRQNRDVKTTEIGYLRMGSQDSKRAKVLYSKDFRSGSRNCTLMDISHFALMYWWNAFDKKNSMMLRNELYSRDRVPGRWQNKKSVICQLIVRLIARYTEKMRSTSTGVGREHCIAK